MKPYETQLKRINMNQPSIWLDGDFETQGMEKSIVKITESLSPESVMKSLSEKAPSVIVTGEHRMGLPLDSVQLPYKWLNSS